MEKIDLKLFALIAAIIMVVKFTYEVVWMLIQLDYARGAYAGGLVLDSLTSQIAWLSLAAILFLYSRKKE